MRFGIYIYVFLILVGLVIIVIGAVYPDDNITSVDVQAPTDARTMAAYTLPTGGSTWVEPAYAFTRVSDANQMNGYNIYDYVKFYGGTTTTPTPHLSYRGEATWLSRYMVLSPDDVFTQRPIQEMVAGRDLPHDYYGSVRLTRDTYLALEAVPGSDIIPANTPFEINFMVRSISGYPKFITLARGAKSFIDIGFNDFDGTTRIEVRVRGYKEQDGLLIRDSTRIQSRYASIGSASTSAGIERWLAAKIIFHRNFFIVCSQTQSGATVTLPMEYVDDPVRPYNQGQYLTYTGSGILQDVDLPGVDTIYVDSDRYAIDIAYITLGPPHYVYENQQLTYRMTPLMRWNIPTSTSAYLLNTSSHFDGLLNPLLDAVYGPTKPIEPSFTSDTAPNFRKWYFATNGPGVTIDPETNRVTVGPTLQESDIHTVSSSLFMTDSTVYGGSISSNGIDIRHTYKRLTRLSYVRSHDVYANETRAMHTYANGVLVTKCSALGDISAISISGDYPPGSVYMDGLCVVATAGKVDTFTTASYTVLVTYVSDGVSLSYSFDVNFVNESRGLFPDTSRLLIGQNFSAVVVSAPSISTRTIERVDMGGTLYNRVLSNIVTNGMSFFRVNTVAGGSGVVTITSKDRDNPDLVYVDELYVEVILDTPTFSYDATAATLLKNTPVSITTSRTPSSLWDYVPVLPSVTRSDGVTTVGPDALRFVAPGVVMNSIGGDITGTLNGDIYAGSTHRISPVLAIGGTIGGTQLDDVLMNSVNSLLAAQVVNIQQDPLENTHSSYAGVGYVLLDISSATIVITPTKYSTHARLRILSTSGNFSTSPGPIVSVDDRGRIEVAPSSFRWDYSAPDMTATIVLESLNAYPAIQHTITLKRDPASLVIPSEDGFSGNSLTIVSVQQAGGTETSYIDGRQSLKYSFSTDEPVSGATFSIDRDYGGALMIGSTTGELIITRRGYFTSEGASHVYGTTITYEQDGVFSITHDVYIIVKHVYVDIPGYRASFGTVRLPFDGVTPKTASILPPVIDVADAPFESIHFEYLGTPPPSSVHVVGDASSGEIALTVDGNYTREVLAEGGFKGVCRYVRAGSSEWPENVRSTIEIYFSAKFVLDVDYEEDSIILPTPSEFFIDDVITIVPDYQGSDLYGNGTVLKGVTVTLIDANKESISTLQNEENILWDGAERPWGYATVDPKLGVIQLMFRIPIRVSIYATVDTVLAKDIISRTMDTAPAVYHHYPQDVVVNAGELTTVSPLEPVFKAGLFEYAGGDVPDELILEAETGIMQIRFDNTGKYRVSVRGLVTPTSDYDYGASVYGYVDITVVKEGGIRVITTTVKKSPFDRNIFYGVGASISTIGMVGAVTTYIRRT